MRTVLGAVLLAGSLVVGTACSDGDDGGDDDDPGLLRIDGPAQVDPDFDPFATVPGTMPAVTTDG